MKKPSAVIILSMFMLTSLSGCGTNDTLPAQAGSNYFAYVANSVSNNVSAYSIDTATGALTAIAGSPFAAGITSISVTVAPSGKFAYVANMNTLNVSGYAINAVNGALSAIVGSPFAAGMRPS